MMYFIGFGSDYKYEELSYRLMRNVSTVYKGSFYKIFTPADLPRELVGYAAQYRRGYGYWIWKPWIILRTLSILKHGDVLLYVDGRSGLADATRSIGWLDEFLQKPEFDLAAWQMQFREDHWTTGDLISSLCRGNSQGISDTGQFAATFHAWRANDRSIGLASLWFNFISRNPSLCRDEASRLPNAPEFKENRHDQSVFSLMLKLLQREGRLKVLTVETARIRADNLLAHQKPHPR